MKAAWYDTFGGPIRLQEVPDPIAGPGDAIIQVVATGLCRSDWHGWMGHDSDVRLPHVPGHEWAGIVLAVGAGVSRWRPGDRVTAPFCMGCGVCPQCQSGNQQICDDYFQPGFTGWGSFAQMLRIAYADHNLVRLPDDMDFAAAATLGCRFITSFRGVVAQGRVQGGEWVAIHGCGGVGLSAIMIAAAMGAQVIAVDIDDAKLALAKQTGAAITLNASNTPDIPQAIYELTNGGAHLSVDALGSKATCSNSILSLRKRGRHIQIGLMAGPDANPPLPMGAVISRELELYGSHGMQAHQYPAMMQMIKTGLLRPDQLIGKRVSLEDGIGELVSMDRFTQTGVTVIDFSIA